MTNSGIITCDCYRVTFYKSPVDNLVNIYNPSVKRHCVFIPRILFPCMLLCGG
jgi:hypothetical protein